MSIRERNQLAGVFIVLDLAPYKFHPQHFRVPFYGGFQIPDRE
jgi:hypothetical protein